MMAGSCVPALPIRLLMTDSEKKYACCLQQRHRTTALCAVVFCLKRYMTAAPAGDSPPRSGHSIVLQGADPDGVIALPIVMTWMFSKCNFPAVFEDFPLYK